VWPAPFNVTRKYALWFVEQTPPKRPGPILNGKGWCITHPKCLASNQWLLTADI